MEAALLTPPPSRIESEVGRLRGLLRHHQFAPALAAAQSLLSEVPEKLS